MARPIAEYLLLAYPNETLDDVKRRVDGPQPVTPPPDRA
jgi:hypothetical protein